MKLIKSTSYQNKIWKNGQGSSAEIEIFPEAMSFQNDKFLWRLSSAKITHDNQFSIFKDYNRILTVIEGSGLFLNSMPLEKFKVARFSGESIINCRLIKNEVLDLGLIFNQDLVQAKMTVKALSAKKSKHVLVLTEGTHFLYCATGSFSTENIKIETKDTLKIEGPLKLEVTLNNFVNYVHIKICEIKNKPSFCKDISK
ncbi:MAG: HutD family protein [Pseudobdellovibrio sp.]